MTTLSFTWSTRRQGNDGYVLEQSSSGNAQEFGPMPAHIVPAFVEARRKVIAIRAKNMSIREAIDDFNIDEMEAILKSLPTFNEALDAKSNSS